MTFTFRQICKFKIMGPPISADKAIYYQTSFRNRAYTKELQWQDQREFRDKFMKLLGLKLFHRYNVPVKLEIEFIYEYPVTWSAPKRKMTYYRTARPHLGGLVKFVRLSLRKKIWVNDFFVTEINAIKHYGDETCTIVTVTPLDNMDIMRKPHMPIA